VTAEYFSKSTIYYFISSEGKIQYDILEKNKNVDIFRYNTNNLFTTKEAAQKRLNEMLS
jgi:archaellum biogenesis ATPase FlaH